MLRTRYALSAATVVAAVALSGCGGSGTTAASTAPAVAKVVAVPFSSSAIHGAELPAVYTCDGRDISPPLSWGAMPSGIEELALFALGVTRGRSGRPSITVEWAVAGVTPATHSLGAGALPPGAFVLEAGDGKRRYSICPAKGQAARYEFALYALPIHIRATPRISGAQLLHNLTESIPQYRAPASGELSTTYKRR